MSSHSLFDPVSFGPMQLKHRVVMAPLTRSRANPSTAVPSELMALYYEQRASDGGLIIGEATNISRSGTGWFGSPGLYTDEQVAGWRTVVDRVHRKGAHMFAQLWHTGRSAHLSTTGGETPVSASVNPEYWEDTSRLVSTPSGWTQPSPHRALEVREIPAILEDYRKAAQNAQAAGFEGVELHAANGYLIDQFLQDGSNKRTDEYGGSIPNRSRLLFEVFETLTSVWGPGRVAVRLGPGGLFNGISDSNWEELFSYVAAELNRFPLAYLHIVEPRVKGNVVIHEGQGSIATELLRKIFKGNIISAGGYEPATAEELVRAGETDAVAFGRHFIANPDLPHRIQSGIPLNVPDRNTFYTFESTGYTDYPTA